MITYTMDMKILVISDTHGNQSMINDMVPIAETADLVIHLGDDYSDALPFIEKKILIFVPVLFPFFLLKFISLNIRQLSCTIGLSFLFQMNEEIKRVNH